EAWRDLPRLLLPDHELDREGDARAGPARVLPAAGNDGGPPGRAEERARPRPLVCLAAKEPCRRTSTEEREVHASERRGSECGDSAPVRPQLQPPERCPPGAGRGQAGRAPVES